MKMRIMFTHQSGNRPVKKTSRMRKSVDTHVAVRPLRRTPSMLEKLAEAADRTLTLKSTLHFLKLNPARANLGDASN